MQRGKACKLALVGGDNGYIHLPSQITVYHCVNIEPAIMNIRIQANFRPVPTRRSTWR